MCIVFWTLDHPDYSLILCSNRDEFLDRPTRSAHFHSFGHEEEGEDVVPENLILSGIDKVGGGTWFGMTRTGRIALLTNITEPPTTLSSSRGSLVSSFLLSTSQQEEEEGPEKSKKNKSLEEEIQGLYPRDSQYAGFNMLLLAPRLSSSEGLSSSSSAGGRPELSFEASFVSNAGAGGVISSRPLSATERSAGGFSNGIDRSRGGDGGEWPKVKHGMQDFLAAINATRGDIDKKDKEKEEGEEELMNRLFELLSWKSATPITARTQLRNTVEVVPLSIAEDKPRKVYGTRLATVVLIRRGDGRVTFVERDVWKLGGGGGGGSVERMPVSEERRFRFGLDIVS